MVIEWIKQYFPIIAILKLNNIFQTLYILIQRDEYNKLLYLICHRTD